MTDTLTAEQIGELEALLAKATPIPWKHVQIGKDGSCDFVSSRENNRMIVVPSLTHSDGRGDMRAISALRNAAPALIAMAKQTHEAFKIGLMWQDHAEKTEAELNQQRAINAELLVIAKPEMWCLSCGTISRNGECDCTLFSDRAHLRRAVPYVDELQILAKQANERAGKAEADLLVMADRTDRAEMAGKWSSDVASMAIADKEKAEDFLSRHGYRRCDIAACNCGSWHGGADDRLAEICQAFNEAGIGNGKTLLDIVKEQIQTAEAMTAQVNHLSELGDDDLVEDLWQDILEKDDRTSSAEYPDMALITFEEFRDNLRFHGAAASLKAEAEATRYREMAVKLAKATRAFAPGRFSDLEDEYSDITTLLAESAS